MIRIPSKSASLWIESTPRVEYVPLEGNCTVDVAIIGGGIAGLTTAYLLKQRGKRVAVFEKWGVGQDISGFTTGKVTSQHGLAYTSLINDFDEQTAKLYGEANQAAIEQIEAIIKAESIDCDWQREDNYVFTENQDDVQKFKKEAHVAKLLGLPAYFETQTPLPFPVKGAVRFENQATFHIGKYLQGLAKAVHGDGCSVFENSKATQIRDGLPCTFKVNGGAVSANEVIIATNVPSPLVAHGAYAFLEYPARSYIVAGKTDRDIAGMYINASKPSRSILPIETNGEKWVLVGGEGHFVGLSGPAAGHYKRLAKYAKEHFGVTKIDYQWSTWDYVAYDHLPLVGKLYPFSKHVYTATGMRKWGLSNGTVAGMILADTLTGRKNEWAHTFRSNRLNAVTSLPKGMIQGIFK